MFAAFARAAAQLGDPAFRRVLWTGLAIAAAVFALLWGAVGWLLAHTALFEVLWLETALDVLGGLAVLVLTWLLFPAVASVALSFYLERVAEAVEARHYPGLPPPRVQSVGETSVAGARFLAVSLLLNLAALLFLVVPPVFPFVFYAVNGYLLSREYYELVALRRLPADRARTVRVAFQGRLVLAGVAIAFLLTVPVVNLVTPLLATAAMVHLVEGWRRRAEAAAA
jgi:uncharacterized protein involved in cysteine biosynthesis